MTRSRSIYNIVYWIFEFILESKSWRFLLITPIIGARSNVKREFLLFLSFAKFDVWRIRLNNLIECLYTDRFGSYAPGSGIGLGS